MNNPIKFRVYDTKEEKYIEQVYEGYNGVVQEPLITMDGFVSIRKHGARDIDGQEYYPMDVFERGRMLVEWCTGSKDKNGVEIFEGDKSEYGYVTYVLGQWRICDKNGDYELLLHYLKEFEIVGNIHE